MVQKKRKKIRYVFLDFAKEDYRNLKKKLAKDISSLKRMEKDVQRMARKFPKDKRHYLSIGKKYASERKKVEALKKKVR